MTQRYDDIPAVRRSDLWELRKSPAHYLYKVTHQEEPEPTIDQLEEVTENDLPFC